MDVTLDDKSKTLHGYIQMHYYNNSPDTLTYIFMHLWPNAYSSDRTAYNRQAVENGEVDFYLDNKENWGFIDSLEFLVDGVSVTLEYTENPDVAILKLNEPLMPGTNIEISTPFRVQIPKTYSRLGHTEESLQITQWYPKPAVYDHKGWHPMPYLGQGEFYSEFGSYRVNITLPADYTVLATGSLQTESEIAWLEEKINKEIARDTRFEGKEVPLKTLTFTEENVHDFAWFADKNWIVRKTEFFIPRNTESTIAYVAYNPAHENGWKSSLSNIKEAVLTYSAEVGLYPYKTVKAIEGRLIAGGGMEYPTITIIVPSNNPETVREVIVHEVGHNWFYGILANNERLYPWLDESINTFYENRIVSEGAGQQMIESIITDQFRMTNNGQAVGGASDGFTSANYGLEVYTNGPVMFNWLEQYVGKDLFRKAMQAYFEEYKFKHVYPEDLKRVMERETGKNLDWFFDGLLNTGNAIDFKVKKVRHNGNQSTITLVNKSDIALPAILDVYHKGEQEQSRRIERIITPPFTGRYEVNADKSLGRVDEVRLHHTVYDNNPRNNVYRNNTSFHFNVRPLISFNHNEYHTLALSPAVGYNYYNGFMAGILAHNITLPYTKWRYALAPLIGFKKHAPVLNGAGFISFTHYPKTVSSLREIEFAIDGKTFGFETSGPEVMNISVGRYHKIAPQVTFYFKPLKHTSEGKEVNLRSAISRSLMLKAYWIGESPVEYFEIKDEPLPGTRIGELQSNIYVRANFRQVNNTTFNPYSIDVDLHGNTNFLKASMDARFKIHYHYKNTALDARVFVGKFIGWDDNPYKVIRYRLAGTYSGWNDYLYDHTFIGRTQTSGLWSQQIAIKEGGMKINTMMYANQLGLSSSWLGAINLSSDLPINRLPLKVFFDIMTFTGARSANPTGAQFLWDAGFQINLGQAASIYIPVVYSKDYRDYLRSVFSKNTFWHSISFSIHFTEIKWSRPLESLNIYSLLK